MKNNLNNTIEKIKKGNKIGIMAHLVTGYPTFLLSRKIAETLVERGVDILEIQIPFSDPMADGPLIVEACQKSLDNGIHVKDSFKLAEFVNKNLKTPVVLMTYANILIHMGIEDFCINCRDSGISGLIVPDLSYDSEECKVLRKYAVKFGIYLIYVISPAVEDIRLKEVQKLSSGFLYCTSRQGTTGTGKEFSKNIISYLSRIRKNCSVPLAVGFGISSSKDLRLIRKYAQIGVIGSAIINIINRHKTSKILPAISKFINELRK